MKKAFTLVELLVTIILFSLLLVVALYSFRFASFDIKNVNNTNPKEAIYYNKLRDAISSIYPYVDVDTQEENRYKAVHYFFKGQKKECFFTTSSGFFFQELVISHLYYKDKALWYEEGIIFDKNIDYKNLETIPLTHRIMIVDDLDKLSFSYLSLEQVVNELNNKLPVLITIEMFIGEEKKIYSFALRSANTLKLETIQEERAGF